MKSIFSKRAPIYSILFLIVVIHVFILTKLIFFPYPELFIYPYLVDHGLKPYSQILDQHFPGLMFFPINLDNLGMNTPETARLWLIAVVIIIHLLLFLIGKTVLKSYKKALLVNLLFLVWHPFFEGWVLWIDSFLPLLLLPAFYFLIKKRIFITGVLLGLSIILKQTIIPLSVLIFFYVFLKTRNLNVIFKFLLGIFIPISLMILYFVNIGVIGDFWYWTVVFNLTTYAQSGIKAPPSVGFITRILFVYVTSILAFMNKEKKNVYILFIFLVGSLIGVFERGDFVHLQPSLPFVCLATIVGLNAIWKKHSAKLIIVGYLLVAVWWLNIFYKGHLMNKVLLFDTQTKNIVTKIKSYTRSGEKIFVFGAVPHLYQMSDTLPAGNIFVFQFPWFLRVSQNRILEGITKDKPEIIVSDRTVIIEGAKIIDFASNIDQYISRNYQKIDSIGTTDILRKKLNYE